MFSSSTTVWAAKQRFDENQVRAAFLYNLTNFIIWPENCFPADDSPFVITILGKNPFGGSLKNIVADEKVGTHPIVIKQIKSLKSLSATQILYIHNKFVKNIEPIIREMRHPGMLTVSDLPGFAEAGGAVNLLIRNKRLILELNIEAARKNGVRFSSKLLRLATIVGAGA